MRIVLTITSILSFAASIVLGVFSFHTVMYVSVIFSTLLLFAANLDRISEFRLGKGWIEAKTREVDALTNKVHVTLEETKKLTILIAETTLVLVKRVGRFGTLGDENEDRIRQKVIESAAKLGLSPKEIEGIQEDWYRIEEHDYVYQILGLSAPSDDQAIVKHWQELRNKGLSDLPGPEELREFFNGHKIMTDTAHELVNDYEYYRLYHNHRRPEVWRDRRNWQPYPTK